MMLRRRRKRLLVTILLSFVVMTELLRHKTELSYAYDDTVEDAEVAEALWQQQQRHHRFTRNSQLRIRGLKPWSRRTVVLTAPNKASGSSDPALVRFAVFSDTHLSMLQVCKGLA